MPKVMKRFQIYKNARAIKDTNSLITAERMFEETCESSDKMADNVELYDSEIGLVIRDF